MDRIKQAVQGQAGNIQELKGIMADLPTATLPKPAGRILQDGSFLHCAAKGERDGATCRCRLYTAWEELMERQPPMRLAQEHLRNHVLKIRPEVLAFALAMEKKLQENDHKTPWRFYEQEYLQERLQQEKEELDAVLYAPVSPEEIAGEAADVGNFAMMLADNVDALDVSLARAILHCIEEQAKILAIASCSGQLNE